MTNGYQLLNNHCFKVLSQVHYYIIILITSFKRDYNKSMVLSQQNEWGAKP